MNLKYFTLTILSLASLSTFGMAQRVTPQVRKSLYEFTIKSLENLKFTPQQAQNFIKAENIFVPFNVEEYQQAIALKHNFNDGIKKQLQRIGLTEKAISFYNEQFKMNFDKYQPGEYRNRYAEYFKVEPLIARVHLKVYSGNNVTDTVLDQAQTGSAEGLVALTQHYLKGQTAKLGYDADNKFTREYTRLNTQPLGHSQYPVTQAKLKFIKQQFDAHYKAQEQQVTQAFLSKLKTPSAEKTQSKSPPQAEKSNTAYEKQSRSENIFAATVSAVLFGICGTIIATVTNQ